MRGETIAANYAATLFELGLRHRATEEYGGALATVAELLAEEPDVRSFLETPRIDDLSKKEVVRRAFSERLPTIALNFLLVVIDRGRQRLLTEMSRAYQALLDVHLGREHVQVTVARAVDDPMRGFLARRLSGMLGAQAIPHIVVEPEILGGVVVRTSDRIFDGSVRGRLKRLRRRLLAAPLIPPGAPDRSQPTNSQPDKL